MSKRPRTFQPNDIEEEYLENNNVNWSALCHKWLKKEMGLEKENLNDKLSNRLLIVLIGLLCIIYTFAINNLFVFVISSVIGIIVIYFGVFSILRMYKHERRV